MIPNWARMYGARIRQLERATTTALREGDFARSDYYLRLGESQHTTNRRIALEGVQAQAQREGHQVPLVEVDGKRVGEPTSISALLDDAKRSEEKDSLERYRAYESAGDKTRDGVIRERRLAEQRNAEQKRGKGRRPTVAFGTHIEELRSRRASAASVEADVTAVHADARETLSHLRNVLRSSSTPPVHVGGVTAPLDRETLERLLRVNTDHEDTLEGFRQAEANRTGTYAGQLAKASPTGGVYTRLTDRPDRRHAPTSAPDRRHAPTSAPSRTAAPQGPSEAIRR